MRTVHVSFTANRRDFFFLYQAGREVLGTMFWVDMDYKTLGFHVAVLNPGSWLTENMKLSIRVDKGYVETGNLVVGRLVARDTPNVVIFASDYTPL